MASFLDVEELFSGDREETEQEVIDSLRQVCTITPLSQLDVQCMPRSGKHACQRCLQQAAHALITLMASFLHVLDLEELLPGDHEETEQEVIDSLRQVCDNCCSLTLAC